MGAINLEDLEDQEKKIAEMRKRRKRALVILHKGQRLKVEVAKQLLGKLRRSHCHYLGTSMPTVCTGKCSPDNGRYVGHGVCLLYKFVERGHGCGRCKEDEVVRQLNVVFSDCAPFKGRELVAEWR